VRRDELLQAADPDAVGDRIRATDVGAGQAHGGHGGAGGHGVETVRRATHRGHRIEIRTTYEIEVDGQPVEGHLLVADDGRVHYHPVPNTSWASAVDLVKQLIDVFPDDFPRPDGDGDDHGGHDHGGHDHGGHDHGGGSGDAVIDVREEQDLGDAAGGHDHHTDPGAEHRPGPGPEPS